MPLYPQGVAFPLGNIPQSHRNILGRNGGLEVWQRGAGGNAAFDLAGGIGAYTADGWFVYSATTHRYVAQVTGVVYGSRYSMAVYRFSGETSVGDIIVEHPLDTDEIVPMRGQLVTLSFNALTGAGWSPAGGIINVILYTGTGAPARHTSGAYTGEATPINTTAAATTTTTRFSFTSTVVIPTDTTQATVFLWWTPTGTADGNDHVLIDDVQLEVGSVATPFERRPFESELAACQRHYWKTFDYNTAPVSSIDQAAGALGFVQVSPASAGQAGMCHSHPMRMRSAPTVTLYNPLAAGSEMRNIQAGADCAGTAAQARDRALMLQGAMPAGSLSGQWLSVHATCDAGI